MNLRYDPLQATDNYTLTPSIKENSPRFGTAAAATATLATVDLK